MKARLLLAALVALTVGCAGSTGQWTVLTPAKRVHATQHHPRLEARVAELHGPRVSGEACSTAFLGLIPLYNSERDEALRRGAIRAALEQAGPDYNAIRDAGMSLTVYPMVLLRTICWSAEGTAILIARRSR